MTTASEWNRLVCKRAMEGPHGVWGLVGIGYHVPRWISLELPWLENKTGKSCLKPGIYKIVIHRDYVTSHGVHLGDVIELIGEERTGRTGVLWHAANTIMQLEGCTAAGKGFGTFLGRPGVSQSRKALDEIIEAIIENKITELHIMQIGEVAP